MMKERIKMMNDKEAAECAEMLENTVPAIQRGEGGPLSRERDIALLEYLDSFSAQYIRAKANATSKSAAQVIGELVHKDLASA
jgi:hypothetical protein